MHLDHEPGNRMFIDFAGDPPHLTDPKTGTQRTLELFVPVFPCGGLIYTEATVSQKTKDLMKISEHTTGVSSYRHEYENRGTKPWWKQSSGWCIPAFLHPYAQGRLKPLMI
jgi:hypothetical protein